MGKKLDLDMITGAFEESPLLAAFVVVVVLVHIALIAVGFTFLYDQEAVPPLRKFKDLKDD